MSTSTARILAREQRGRRRRRRQARSRRPRRGGRSAIGRMLRPTRRDATCEHRARCRSASSDGSRPSSASSSSSPSLAVVGKAWWDSRLPDTYSVMSYGTHDYGGGPEPPNHEGTRRRHAASPTCTGRATAAPDARFELTARAADDPPLVGARRPRADLQRDVARPGASRPAGRPRRGRAPQRGRRARA